MITEDDVDALGGSDAVDRDGRVIGEVEQVYLDDRTGTPTWVAVETGLASGPQFVPLHEAWMEGGEVTFPYTRDRIARAPQLPPGEHLGVEQERRLYDHYGVEYDDAPADGERDRTDPTGEENSPSDGEVRAPLPGAPTAPPADDGGAESAVTPETPAVPEPPAEPVTLFEERLVVGKRVRVSGTTRIATRVVTEERTITVTVRREELVVDHQPSADRERDDVPATGGDAQTGLDVHPLTHTPRVIVLHEEVPVVTLQTRPVQTVHVDVRAVTVEQQVTDNVRREHLDG